MAQVNNDRVREWEDGLPTPAELTPLSLSLISPELASAFSISSEQVRFRTMADVNRASESTFANLRHSSSLLLPHFLVASQSEQALDDNSFDIGADEQIGDHQNAKSAHGVPGGFLPNNKRGFVGSSRVNNLGPNSFNAEQKQEGSPEIGAAASVAPCLGGTDSSDGTARNPRVEMDLEPEEAESGPIQDNSNEDQATRTPKRPRLVWTPELHKRFVEAVAHLGIKNAVPKTIMQLMNVEGLTRENVASHLQKYRLYLKRMQGLSTEGPSSSDQLFASTPVPPSLAASTRFLTGIPPGHMEEAMPVPFPAPHGPISLGRPHLAGNVNAAGPFAPMGPYTYNTLPRAPPQMFMPGDQKEMFGSNQSQPASSSHHILQLFRTGSQ